MDFTEVDELAAKVKAMRPLSEAELERLQEEFIVENTYNSCAIEGNTLTLDETALILQKNITISEKPLRDHLESIGHKDAMKYIISTINDTLTDNFIKNIHSLVLINDPNNKGIYRNVNVRVGSYIPPQPYLIPIQMEELLVNYAETLKSKHVLEAVSEFHLRFEQIHPFVDGNGRTGRLILNLELVKAGFLPVNIKFTDRRQYYDCFVSKSTESLIKLINEYEIAELKRRLNVFAPFLCPVPEPQEIPTGEPFTPVAPLPVEGFTFLGWYTDRDLTIPFVNGTIIKGDTQLYGKWKRDALDKSVSKVRYFGITPPIEK